MYTDQATIESHLGVTFASSALAFLTLAINAVDEYINTETGTSFGEPEEYEEETMKYDGNDKEWLEIDDVCEISKVTIDGVEQVAGTDYVAYPANETPKQYIRLINETPKNSRLMKSAPFVFTKGVQNIEVTGKFYYSEEVPNAIKVCATLLVGALVKNAVNNAGTRVIASESIGDYNVSYESIATAAETVNASAFLSQFIRPVRSESGFIV
jgi:hypothetical protein